MSQEFTCTKDFSVGDLFLDADGKPYCFIIKITQWKKGAQYQYEMSYFNNNNHYSWKYMNTARLKDKLTYYSWKRIPVVR